MCGIRRANLDAFWAQRLVTVKSNLPLMLSIMRVREEVHGILRGHMFRPQAPHPVEVSPGMTSAVVLPGNSVNAGMNADTVQFHTIRKTRSAMSNNEKMTAPETHHVALAGYKRDDHLVFTNTSMYILWFDRFIVGFRVIMGDDTRQDRAFRIERMLVMQMLLEEDLLQCQSMESMLNVSLHGVFLIAGFCGGLRGKDLPLLSLDAIFKYIYVAQPRSAELANVYFAL
jgi:hypothetical protein